MTTRQIRPVWHPTPRQRQFLTIAAVIIVAALLWGRPTMLSAAAPFVGVLLARYLRPPARDLHVDWEQDRDLLVEGEEVAVRVRVRPGVARLTGRPAVGAMPANLRTDHHRRGGDTADSGGGGVDARWVITPRRWGRWPIGPLTAQVVDHTGLLYADLSLPLREITVYPSTPRPGLLPVIDRLAGQLGAHVATVTGHGGEFALVRPLQPGDSARHINWPVSNRLQQLHVNQRFAERAMDVVLAIDTFSDVGPPGRTTLDVAVRGAAATASGYLHQHDRVGLVVLGGMLRWLGPGSTSRQFQRILDYVLAMPRWDSVVDPKISRVPRHALPPGALVVMFSPLLDDRALHVLTDLRHRGFRVVVVDVLTTEPPSYPGRSSRRSRHHNGLALRLWRLERLALRYSLAEQGVAMVAWDGAESLATVFGSAGRPWMRRRS